MPKSKQYQTLRTVAKFLRLAALGARFNPVDFKLMADLCALSLPKQYRWTREELDAEREFIKEEIKNGT